MMNLHIKNILFTKKFILGIIVLSTFILSFTLFQTNKTVYAAYDGGRIIDNSIFLNSNSMSISSIQSFLVNKNSGLKDMNFNLQCYGTDSKERQLYTSAGARCDTPIPASQIIYYASQIYGVNPQVILATMQKEQSLTTAPNPTSWQLNQAMGYACPTSGSCESTSSFPYQIDAGTWALRYHFERARGNMNWWNPSTTWTCGTEKNLYKPNLYPQQNVQFFDTNGTLYATIYIENAATSAFYCYTPHAYNNPQGLYGRAPYGTTGLYYSGSYNFVTFFELWFGSTKYIYLPGCTEGGGIQIACIWKLRNITDNTPYLVSSITDRDQIMNSGNYIFDGTYFFGNTSSNKKPWNIPIYRLIKPNGDSFLTADINERNSLISAGFIDKGIDFYANPPSDTSNSGYSIYRLYSYNLGKHVWVSTLSQKSQYMRDGYTYEGVAFHALTISNQPPPPPVNQLNIYRFYIQSTGGHFFTTDLTERDNLLKQNNFIYEGVSSYGSFNTTTKPVYRLYSSSIGEHLFTTSVAEKDKLIMDGAWKYEGIGLYANDSSTTKPVYRLYSSSLNRHFWTENVNEKNSLVSRGLFTLEEIGWYSL